MRLLSASLLLTLISTQAGAESPVAPRDVFSDQPTALFAVEQTSHDEPADVAGPLAPAPAAPQGVVQPYGDGWSPVRARRRSGKRPVFGADPDRFYASITVGSQWIDGEISGLNTSGPFRNYGTGHDDDEFLIGGALGTYLPGQAINGRLRFRAEVEGMERQSVSFVTPSFPGPPGPAVFFYNTSVTDIWSVHGNLWLDLALTQRVGLYSGFGLGVAGKDVAVNDTVVEGARGTTGFSYNVGAGFNFSLTDDITVDLGYRYYDLGDVNVPLAVVRGGVPAGNYRVGLDSSEIRLTLRIDLF